MAAPGFQRAAHSKTDPKKNPEQKFCPLPAFKPGQEHQCFPCHLEAMSNMANPEVLNLPDASETFDIFSKESHKPEEVM